MIPVSYLNNASSPGSYIYNTTTTSSHMIITQHVTWKQKSGLLSQQAQESARYPPDPFPRERVGSGDETKDCGDLTITIIIQCKLIVYNNTLYKISNTNNHIKVFDMYGPSSS